MFMYNTCGMNKFSLSPLLAPSAFYRITKILAKQSYIERLVLKRFASWSDRWSNSAAI